MTNKSKYAEQKAPLFEDGVDYTVKTTDRIYALKLDNGQILYLNKKQYSFMKNDSYKERRENYIRNRCTILAERGGTKKCKNDCGTCPWFMTNKTNGGQVSLDALYDKDEYEHPDDSRFDSEDVNRKEIIVFLKAEIEKIKDEIDKKILKLLLDGKTEREIAIILNFPKSTIHVKKTKLFTILKEKIEKSPNFFGQEPPK